MDKRSYKLLIGASGSVAAIKIPVLIKTLLESPEAQPQIHLIVTQRAKHFFKKSDLPPGTKVYDDKMEWSSWKARGDPVMHIDLGKMADVMLLAPLTANTLAKVALGFSDNLLTCTTRAWDPTKPLVFCPSMNARMWEHPITRQHIDTLKDWGYIEIPPANKKQMCGTVGSGAMAEVKTIADKIGCYANQYK
ncbi:phosphopantothenoylcysteine decarboxylase-like [Trichoplusia ni]|uniref:Phosphopantothenoylcysteine decarboxylase-like n=1 Tax=Trichoplusia ni TaxID=7111 RepID=A0A7E5WDS6_TRINI|nr:phosphopantothenoylcysteine decarboxylase-like [Trichoplusia ni]